MNQAQASATLLLVSLALAGSAAAQGVPAGASAADKTSSQTGTQTSTQTGTHAEGAAAQTSSQAGAQTSSQAAQTSSQDSAVRVRASHRVEVIAPGERVETIIDRMRAGTQTTATQTALPSENLQVRPAELQRAPDRGAGDRQHGARGSAPGGPPGAGGPPPERR
jgi:hypothetical protein